MEFRNSDRSIEYQELLQVFMEDHVYPAESTYHEQIAAAAHPHIQPAVMEELKREARKRGLWNLFHPNPAHGPGLSNVEYAPLAELQGRSRLGAEACNCSAPDTGNMEVLSSFGSEEHKEKYLKPLLDGTIRSAFAMTEPDVASSDPTNIALMMQRVGDEYILNGRKWFATNGLHPHCKVLIVMGRSSTTAARHRCHSMAVVPIDSPGVTVVRNLPVFGYHDVEGHAEIAFHDVRVPATDILLGEGEGFGDRTGPAGPRPNPPLYARNRGR